MAGRKTFLLRIEEETYEALRRWANDEFRSLNGQIEFLLRKALREHRRSPAEESQPGGSWAPPRDK
jgi:hypothetical protein